MRRIALLLLLVAATARGDLLKILDDPGEAEQARIDLMREAGRGIDALYFLARNDPVTLRALAEVRDARRRGVGARIVVDANFLHIPKALLAHLLDEGVGIRVYHPLTLRHPTWLWRRMHDKLVIADGARYITGGRNLAESYFGLSKRRNYVDRDVYVEGESAAEADRYFESVWSSGDVRRLHVRVSAREKQEAARMLDAIDPPSGAPPDWTAGLREVAEVRLIHNTRDHRVASRVAAILDSATESIVIESPYVVPSGSMLALLERKIAAGVEVTIVTNSFRSTDGVLPYVGYLKYRRRLVRDGVDLREFKGPDTLHAKSMVIDGRVALIGSYNFDHRSQDLDTEVICVAEDAATANALLESIGVHVENSWSANDSVAAPMASFRIFAARLILPLIENQL